MITPPQPQHHENAIPTTGRHRRRTIVVTAAAVGVAVASIAVAGADSSTDDGQEEIALGSTWS